MTLFRPGNNIHLEKFDSKRSVRVFVIRSAHVSVHITIQTSELHYYETFESHIHGVI